MVAALVTGSGMILATVVFHVVGLVMLSSVLTVAGTHLNEAPKPLRSVGLFLPSVLVILFLHVVEAWMWALVFLSLGEFETLEAALYFSTVTATTLGYGDVTLSEGWRLISSFEAMGGLILFAASTAFLIELMRAALDLQAEPDRR